jgi:hypothetical protein
VNKLQISKEDLNWLYWGDEINQIIATLTNEENKFKIFLENRTRVLVQEPTINNSLYNIISALKFNKNFQNFYLNKDQESRLYQLNEKYKFKSYDEDTKDAIIIMKQHYCFNDFLEPEKLNNTIHDIQIFLKEYGCKRQYREVKNMIKDAFGYL